MSNKIDTRQTIGTAKPVVGDAQQLGVKLKPTPIAAHPNVVGPEPTSSSYSAILAEATDGDAQEAAALAKLGRAKPDGVKEDDGEKPEDSEAGLNAKSVSQPQQGQRDKNHASKTDRIEKKSQVTVSADKIETIKATKFSAESLSDSHDELMLLTGSMKRNEISNFISNQYAQTLASILENPAWQRETDGPERLVAIQMQSVSG